jgi:hypothetical protein
MATNCLLVYRVITITCSMILEHRPLMTYAIDICIFFFFLPYFLWIKLMSLCFALVMRWIIHITCILTVIHTETNCILLYFTIPSCLPLILISAWMWIRTDMYFYSLIIFKVSTYSEYRIIILGTVHVQHYTVSLNINIYTVLILKHRPLMNFASDSYLLKCHCVLH